MSLKDKILQAEDLPREPLVVPEWGITEDDGGFIRGLSGTERDAWETRGIKQRGDKFVRDTSILKDVRASLVALCLVDADGERVFSDKEVKDLSRKSGRVLDRLFDRARALSGLTEEDVEELVEGFGEGPSDEDGSA